MRSLALAVLLASGLAAQQAPPPADSPAASAEYVIGPGDQLVLRAIDIEEINEKPLIVNGRGFVKLPLAGRIRAEGLTPRQLERELMERLKEFVRDPDVVVSVAEYRSQPVSVLGAVASPGVHQLQGRKTLFEILSMAGGLRQDAGNSIKITRRKQWGSIPLPNAADDSTGQFSVAQVSVKSVMEARHPEENILICPNDVISVPKAEMVYVIGAVKRAGGFVLNERETVTLLQVLSMAEGLERTASAKHAKILRPVAGSAIRAEIPVDLSKVMAGQSADIGLRADDILFVPTSAAKSATLRTIEAAVQIGTGFAIWRR